MTDLTVLLRQWISCSNDLWSRWFSSTESGASEFPDIELALLRAMVFDKASLASKGLSVDNFFERLRVVYPSSIDDEVRQFCVVQRAGNIFCRPYCLSVSAGSTFQVRSIDTMGTMDSGRPYVEVKFDGGYILESPDFVEFAIELGR